ncbi:MAG: ubiquinone/menaquinone biosynthesis methyltransferase [Bacteriovoracaceae bacterium]|nr:ubiquinone/menaquinone biosynthesis methyltransferase [Bacteriovoracaceae bacterium]
MPKSQVIKPMFDILATKYDFFNDLLSLFIHRYWKRKVIEKVGEFRPKNLLDCATGTGDLAFMAASRYPHLKIEAIDFSSVMIEVAKKKLGDGPTQAISFSVQDIQKLPFSDQQFDVTTISFGIRNVENLTLGLKELGRVSKKSLLILEFGKPKNKIISKIMFQILYFFVPLLGTFSKDKSAYHYLIESSEKFPCRENFINLLIANTNFKKFSYQSFMGGLVYLYCASNSNENTNHQ